MMDALLADVRFAFHGLLRRSVGVTTLALLTACASALQRRDDGPPTWEESIAGWYACPDRMRYCSGWGPFQRIEDPQWGDIWWVVSMNGNGCEVLAKVFPDFRRGQRYTCAWRQPRQ